jgi:2-keto-4-pentenoate hydratase/2-oxohepta-3-ene-1,7-dioic acid hydratase in catechol pathway
MKWIKYSIAGASSYGLLEDQKIVAVKGDPFGGYEKTSTVLKLADVQIELPVVPPTFYCVGLNYVKHIGSEGKNIPTRPEVGYRANNALIPHGHDVVMPADSKRVHYEGELVVVIGKRAKNVSIEEAGACILGYTMGNDVSERDWQASDRTFWRSKNTDTFKPMGPWIETDVDLDKMETVVKVNGEVKTHFGTNDMLFGVHQFISTMSQYSALQPGDVIWMGTDGQSPNLQHGDQVDVSLTGIGTLSNRFVKAS